MVDIALSDKRRLRRRSKKKEDRLPVDGLKADEGGEHEQAAEHEGWRHGHRLADHADAQRQPRAGRERGPVQGLQATPGAVLGLGDHRQRRGLDHPESEAERGSEHDEQGGVRCKHPDDQRKGKGHNRQPRNPGSKAG